MDTQGIIKIPNGRHKIIGFDPPKDHAVVIHTTAGDLLVKGGDVNERRVFMGITSDPPFVEKSTDGKKIIIGMAEGTVTCIKYSLGVSLE